MFKDGKRRLLKPSEIAGYFATSPKKSTIYKWMKHGVLNRRTGQQVYLHYEVEGGRMLVPETAVADFQAALNQGKPA